MKDCEKLELLKPTCKSGYLSGGKGQAVTYIDLSTEINLEMLEGDVKKGAKQFAELLEFAKKKPSRFVMLDAQSEEEGLMGVSYLAGIYNEADGVDYYNCVEPDCEDEDIEFADFDDPLCFEDDEDDDEDYSWENREEWVETPWKIPVLDINTIIQHEDGNGFNPFGMGNMDYVSQSRNKNRQPFWYYTRKEAVCIVNPGLHFFGPSNHMVAALKRFANNRHVYIINVRSDANEVGSVMGSDDMSFEQQVLCEVILEYAAGTLKISMEEEEKRAYYDMLFQNWVEHYSKTLEKGFPITEVVQKIVAMRDPAKSEMMEKVIRYILKDEDTKTILTAKDFEILDKFKALGVHKQKKEKTMSLLDQNLIGLDNVKEQMRNIVAVMKYNKRRKKAGLETGNFHNVHMLLGAPGTAKTTVAQMLGEIMVEEHLLANDRFIAVNGAELKGMYVGHSAPKVKALFDEYDIIFIDEAYAVAAGHDGASDSFSQEAVAQLIVELENHGMDKLVLFAGYGGDKMSEKDNKMKQFLQANPGIRSRINSTILFDSYTPEQMVEIFFCQAKIQQYKVDKKVADMVKNYFEGRVKDPDFGNGREARSLLENASMEAASRISKLPDSKITKKVLSEIKVEDVEKAIEKARKGILAQKAERVANCGFAV